MLWMLKLVHLKPVLCKKDPPRWEVCAQQKKKKEYLHSLQLEDAQHSNKEPAQPKYKVNFLKKEKKSLGS